MKKRVVIFLFFLIVIIAAALMFSLSENDVGALKVEVRQMEISGKNGVRPPISNAGEKSQSEKLECVIPTKKDLLDSRNLWTNIHFKKNGDIFRLRLFTDDGENGEYRKLVLMKEGPDGFPDIIEKREISPDDNELEVVKNYFKGGEVIYREEAVSFGEDYFAKTIDGKIVELQSNGKRCLISD